MPFLSHLLEHGQLRHASFHPSVCPFIHLSVCQHLQRNSSYTFVPTFFSNFAGVFFMVWGCTCGLDIIVGLFFCYFFHFVNLVIFRCKCIDSGYLVSATPHTILYQSFLNFAHVFSMVWRSACCLDIILALMFVSFSSLWTLSFSDVRFYESV